MSIQASHPAKLEGPPIPQAVCVCLCAFSWVSMRLSSVEYCKVESCVSGGGVSTAASICVSRKCDVQEGVSVLLKVSMLI